MPSPRAPSPTLPSPTLRIRGLTKRFTNHLRGGVTRAVLRGVDLDVEPGQCVALTGASGSGKSSLLRCVYGTYTADAGSIHLRTAAGTVDLATAPDRELIRVRRDHLGMVTQFLSVPPRVSARDLVAERGLGPEAAAELLARLGLDPALHGLAPATFSGGERQLVNIAIALARPRPVLLLDEITASLDRHRRATVLRALAERKADGTALLAIFHEMPDQPGLIDRICRLDDGRVLEAA
ncbi:ATP-binding cassette domain-containing protein [Frankia sp. CNm7]|nr:ATP-binding cassette domain-containing protein [Frankia nepalensis]MBL7512667.1 ATP-binding cassette domain-containing protein [Frankia nepalensis]MBL7523192.1 ATP-binding cassette domain-containing protein [Frankia nepalensis]